MIKQLQPYSSGIIVLGIGMLSQSAQRADLVWLVGGILTLLLGSIALLYQRWPNVGWLLAGLGAAAILLGTAESVTLWGYSVQPPDMVLVVGGAALTMAGMALVGFSYTVAHGEQPASERVQRSPAAPTAFRSVG